MLTRREFGMASAAAAAGAQTGARRRPNIIVMLTDDMGYQDLGCTGSDYIRTPHIDRMAAEGVRATSWYSNAPVCSPSRGALLTGRYPARNGVVTNGIELAASEKSIADLLRPAGYATGMAGKWHLGSSANTSPNGHGFNSFFGFHSGCIDFFSHRFYWGEPKTVNYHDLWRNREEVFEDGAYFTDLIRREALAFIDRAKAKPFFLYLPFNAPHYPMHASEKYLARFRQLPVEQRVRAAMIAAVDDTVGEIRAHLAKFGLLRDTLILFTSDNGATREPRGGLGNRPPEAGSNQPFRGYKFSLFDGGIHLPAIWSWPGTLPAGRLYDGLGAHMDVLPTVCAGGRCRTAGRAHLRWTRSTGGTQGRALTPPDPLLAERAAIGGPSRTMEAGGGRVRVQLRGGARLQPSEGR